MLAQSEHVKQWLLNETTILSIINAKIFFFFFNATFFLMLVYVLKKKREHATYDIRDSYYKPVTPTLCLCNLRTITQSGSRTWVSGAGCGRSNKERQRLQPLASIG